MHIDLNGLRILSGLVFAGCLLSACGGDEEGDDDANAGQGGEAGSSGGSKASAGAGQGGGAGKGGAGKGGTTSSGGTGGTGGSSGSGGSAGKSSSGGFDDCEPPSAPLQHCYAENDDRPGTAVCSEYYLAGTAALFCESPEAGGCPRDAELEAICMSGITSSFYYADVATAGFWSETGPGCEVNGGTWCTE
jgi:hypothetical protein